jgi:exo-1,4-beta-D-glucosaminidase
MNEFNNHRTKVFQVNGKNIVIRGGGYVEDLMMRPSNERVDADLHYLKFMNMNALRMEAPRGSDYLFERCDEEGIMVMVGWCCCSAFERWKSWTPHTARYCREKLARPGYQSSCASFCFHLVVRKR